MDSSLRPDGVHVRRGQIQVTKAAGNDWPRRVAAQADDAAIWWPDAMSAQAACAEALSVSNLRRTWVDAAALAALDDDRAGVEHAVQVKIDRVPYVV